MTHLRVSRTGEHDLSLEAGGGVLHAFGEGGPGGYEDLLAPLSQLILRLNERFGGDLSEADRLHLEGIGADMAADPEVQQQAAANTEDNFGIEFDRRFEKAVTARMNQAEELTIRILDTPELQAEITRALMPRVYERLEFKSTLRWNLEKGEKSKLVESAAIKTVAAFLNSEFGGTLLIGVADEGAIVGLEGDYATLRRQGKDDADLFLLHLNQLLENAVGLAAAANVTTTIHRVDGHDIGRVHVEPSGHPVEAEVTVADQQGQLGKTRHFYVRLNNGTRAVEDETERERYIAQRVGQSTGTHHAVGPSERRNPTPLIGFSS